MNRSLRQVKALAFDVFGTVVDWRGSLIKEGRKLGRRKGIKVDWTAFADAWRAGYRPAMDRVRRGELGWTRIDDLHRMILDGLIREFGLTSLSEDERVDLNRAWHRLAPWKDAVAGVKRLKKRYVLATMSNGNVALLVNMAKRAGLPWDVVLSAEIARHYKPDPEAYLSVPRLLGIEPGEVLMVAAHKDDLDGAARAGLRTAFVARPLEFGDPALKDVVPEPRFDANAKNFLDLARQLGC
ncbi:MAG: haloacid dehalogenase type II [Betaproteobacteria bacterium]|jgi:2-haloacid dehalogenase|nr:haloacid dehalogenase type II [Betaproteobacteria bacterium]